MLHFLSLNIQPQDLAVSTDSPENQWLFSFVKDGAYKFKGIFCEVYEYAGKADLNKCYWNSERKLGETTHFSKIMNQQYLQKALSCKAMYDVLFQIEA